MQGGAYLEQGIAVKFKYLERAGLKRMKKNLAAFTLLALLNTTSSVLAHSGMTDSRGGHNCYVGSCAGSYHFHGGRSSSSSGIGIFEIAFVAIGIWLVFYWVRGQRGKSETQARAKSRTNTSKNAAHNSNKTTSSRDKLQTQTVTENPKREFRKEFVWPIVVEIKWCSKADAWKQVSEPFQRWFLGYLSGFLLYQANPKQPMEILEAGMWSQQAGWERLSSDVNDLILAICRYAPIGRFKSLKAFKVQLSNYLVADKDWMKGAEDGVKQAESWNTTGTLLPLLDSRLKDYHKNKPDKPIR